MIEIRGLDPSLLLPLGNFFSRIDTPEIREHFSPHEFTDRQAERLCRQQSADQYFVAVHDGRILAYGMLRGWDEGHEIPSLGICVDPGYRRVGLGDLMMSHLVCVARMKGVPSVRLKVKRDNARAIALYRKVGFTLAPLDGEYLKGTLDLGAKHGSHAADRRG
jgi:ribosomal protein S18 acetylase RimI-like enzyme